MERSFVDFDPWIMNLTLNPAIIAYLCLKIDIKLYLIIKIEKFQHGVFAEKIWRFRYFVAQRYLSVSADFVTVRL